MVLEKLSSLLIENDGLIRFEERPITPSLAPVGSKFGSTSSKEEAPAAPRGRGTRNENAGRQTPVS